MQVRLAEVDVAQGGGDLVVSQQSLQRGQVRAALQQVGGVAVPQRVRADLLVDPRGVGGTFADALDVRDAEVSARLAAGEEPEFGSVTSPVVAQTPEQDGGERHEAVLAALAPADEQGHPGGIDVGRPQAEDLADPQAGGVSGPEDREVARVADGGEEAGDLVGTQDGGQGAGPLAEGDHLDDFGALQSDAKEKAQGADGLVEAAPGSLLLEEVELVQADVLGVESLRREAEVLGEASDVGDVSGDGARGEVAQLQVVSVALPKRRHERLLAKAGDSNRRPHNHGLFNAQDESCLLDVVFFHRPAV